MPGQAKVARVECGSVVVAVVTEVEKVAVTEVVVDMAAAADTVVVAGSVEGPTQFLSAAGKVAVA